MSFLDHLDELRRRIIYSLLALVFGLAIALFFIRPLFQFIFQPMQALLPAGQTLIYTDPSEAFFLQIKIALMAGLILASPAIASQVWLFIAPGLYAHEKKLAVPFVIMSSTLFVAGAAFAPRSDHAAAHDPPLQVCRADHRHRLGCTLAGRRRRRNAGHGWTGGHPLYLQHRSRLGLREEEDQAARRSFLASAVVDEVAASSRPSEVDRLIADLRSSDPVRREASVARLRVIGARAVARLGAFIASSVAGDARVRAVRALDGIGDPQAAEIALSVLRSPDADAVIAALGVLRAWVTRETGTRLLEAIAAIAVDHDRDARMRAAALDALSDLPEHLLRPIREQAPPPEASGPPGDNPVAAREWIEAHGGNATLSTLHDAIAMFRDAEGRAETRRAGEEWMRARGAAHRLLAERGSRLALYDARETVGASHTPLPPGFLDAMRRVGDGSCLEPLARAWSSTQDPRWRTELARAAHEIMKRSKLGARSTAVKAVRANWAGFL
jgi:hypothetical protein